MLNDLLVFQKMYSLVLWIYPAVRKFPKGDRYVLGERIEECALNILEAIISANHEHEKAESLKNASVELEKLRIFLRLAKDLRLVSFNQYEYASKEINEAGKLLGGLIKKFHSP